MNKHTLDGRTPGTTRADIDVSKWPPLNEIIAHLAWEVEQPNSHPLCLYEPLILAIGRRLAMYRRNNADVDTRYLLQRYLPVNSDGGSFVGDRESAGATRDDGGRR